MNDTSSAATTMLCRYCGRPIVRMAPVYGNAGEPYHSECTRPPHRNDGLVVLLVRQGNELHKLNKALRRKNRLIEDLRARLAVHRSGLVGDAIQVVADTCPEA